MFLLGPSLFSGALAVSFRECISLLCIGGCSLTGSIQDILRTGKVAESSISDEAGGFAKKHQKNQRVHGWSFCRVLFCIFQKKQRLISFG